MSSEELLTETAQEVLELPLPESRVTEQHPTRHHDVILSNIPNAETVGEGYGRSVVWLPELPHREPTPTEEEQMYDGCVIKFAYNDCHEGSGLRQNETENGIWKSNNPPIEHEHLTPVFEADKENRWLIMPFREIVPTVAIFEDKVREIFGELPTGDLASKHSWGMNHNHTIECTDYGRLPL